jgi:hypothetical protein
MYLHERLLARGNQLLEHAGAGWRQHRRGEKNATCAHQKVTVTPKVGSRGNCEMAFLVGGFAP